LGALVQELFRFRFFKRSQGRIARQATFVALAAIFALGGWSLSEYYQEKGGVWQYGIPLVIVALGLWISFRVVQIPAFADFLIHVEGEMGKVSWPARGELFRASIVVILVIFFLAFLLFGYDVLLTEIMKGIAGLVDRLFG
jgi:preprotein translocase subunit SecE